MYRFVRILLALVPVLVFIGCGGDSSSSLHSWHAGAPSSVETTAAADSSEGAMLAESATRLASDWQPPAGMLINVPEELRDEFDEVYELCKVQHNTTLHIALDYGLNYRRALAYYLFGLYERALLNRLVLVMAPGPQSASQQLAENIANANNCAIKSSCYLGERDVYYLVYPVEQTRQDLADSADSILLSNYPDVAYCGAETYMSFADYPYDPEVRYELGQCYSPLQISAPVAWDKTEGSEQVVVAVFDTGIYRDIDDNTHLPVGEHEDLEGICYNLGDFGYRVNFSNFSYTGEESPYSPWEDLNDPSPGIYPYLGSGHGTRVIGVIAAQNNLLGVVGIAPEIKVAPFRLYSPALLYMPVENFTAAAQVCTQARIDGHPIRIVNISAHVEDEETPDLELAIRQMAEADILIVSTSTGNEANALGDEPFWLYPAAYKAFARGDPIPNILDVAWLGIDSGYKDSRGSTTYTEDDWDWSLTDIFAPSEHMMLTNADGAYINDPPHVAGGVSFGIPAAAGVAALAFSKDPWHTADQVKAQVIGGATTLYNFGNGQYKSLDAASIGISYGLFPISGRPYKPATYDFITDSYHDLLFRQAYENPEPPPGELHTELVFELRNSQRGYPDDWTVGDVTGHRPYMEDAAVDYLGLGWPLGPEGYAIFHWYNYGYQFHEIQYELAYRNSPGEWILMPDALFDLANIYVENHCYDFSLQYGGVFYLHRWSVVPGQPHVSLGLRMPPPHGDEIEYAGEPWDLLNVPNDDDTLLITAEDNDGTVTQRVYWYQNPVGWAEDPIVEDETGKLWCLGEVGSLPGIAWLDPGTRQFNIGYLDDSSGTISWLSGVSFSESDLPGAFHGTPAKIWLLGNTSNKAYFVVAGDTQGQISTQHSFSIEGIRVNWAGDGLLANLTKETVMTTDFKEGTGSELVENIHLNVDPLDRAHVIYVYDYQGYAVEVYTCKTLDFGNEP